MKNHIFPTFLPEVALAGTHTAAISAFHTPLTHRGTDRQCGPVSLKWLPSHAGWLDSLLFLSPHPHTPSIFILCLKLGSVIFSHQIMIIKMHLRHNGGDNNYSF